MKMRETNRVKVASEILRGLLKTSSKAASDDYLTLNDIMEGLHGRGFGLLMLLFALPLSIPLPVPPGYTTILGFPLLVFSLQMVLGQSKPWMPNWLKKKKLSRSTLAMFIEKTSPMLVAIERVLKPRMVWATQGVFMERACGVFCLILAISIALPLPLTNFVPAIGIALISLGLMSRDGLFIVLGFLSGIVGLALSCAIIIFGTAAIKSVFNFFIHKIIS